MQFIQSHLGELFSFITALIWAFAVILFKKSGEKVHPLALNLFKNVLALILFLPTVYILGGTLSYNAPAKDYVLLILSGVIGIGIADTLFLKSLNLLGAGLSSIVVCMYSPFVIFLSVIWLGETLTFVQIIGGVLVISAVLSAVTKNGRGHISRRTLVKGMLLGIGAQLLTAIGIIIFKPILDRSPLLWLISIRLIAGTIGLILIFLFYSKKKDILYSLTHTGSWIYTISSSFLGAYLAMIVWLIGMKFTQASVAAILNQTSNVFIFVFAWLFLKEKINLQRIIGIILAIIGAILVSLG